MGTSVCYEALTHKFTVLIVAAVSKPAAAASSPPKTELVLGRKWCVENHTGDRSLVIDQTDAKQSVYIFNCSNCTIQVCCVQSPTPRSVRIWGFLPD